MAHYCQPTRAQERGWGKWVKSRPENVRAIAERFDPWSLYRMKSTGQRVTLVSFGEQEDGKVTLTVSVTGEFNSVVFDRNVFGIDPDDLEPCELPTEADRTGTLLSAEADIEEFIDYTRPMILARREQ
jgi:hypothetical protein